MSIANDIIVYRQLNDLTQQEFARKIGVSRETVSNWEKGKTTPEKTMLVKLAFLFDKKADHYLIEQNQNASYVNNSDDNGSKQKYYNNNDYSFNDLDPEFLSELSENVGSVLKKAGFNDEVAELCSKACYEALERH